jgi:hypothetical protein
LIENKKLKQVKAGSHIPPTDSWQGQALRVLNKNLHPPGRIFDSKTLPSPPPALLTCFLFSFLFPVSAGFSFLFSLLNSFLLDVARRANPTYPILKEYLIALVQAAYLP